MLKIDKSYLNEESESFMDNLINVINFYGDLNQNDSICCIERQTTNVASHLSYTRPFEATSKLSCLPDLKCRTKSGSTHPFDKLILFDCTYLIDKIYEFFQWIIKYLKPTEGKLVILNRIGYWPPIRSSIENRSKFVGGFDDECQNLIKCLLDAGFDLEWDVRNDEFIITIIFG